MGTIYIDGKEAASYVNGEVRDKTGRFLAYYNESNGDIYQKASAANNYFAVYRYGKIYRKSGFTESEVGKIISGRDWNGYDGKIVDTSGNTVAFYRGEECVGLAAAAASAVFHLDGSSSSESSSGCIAAVVRVLLLILLAVPIFVWCFLPLVICIFLLLENGVDFANDADGFFLVAIPLLIAGICSICIIYNSLKSRITKFQANLCRLINNGGMVLAYIINLWRDSVYSPFSISTIAEKSDPPALYIVLPWVSGIILFAATILAFIYLHKCKSRNKQ